MGGSPAKVDRFLYLYNDVRNSDASNRIGEDAMLHLLSETSIFVSLPNGCLCQMTGDPILHIRPPFLLSDKSVGVGHGPSSPERGAKRRRVGEQESERPCKRRKREHRSGVDVSTATKQPPGERSVKADVLCVSVCILTYPRAGSHRQMCLSLVRGCSTRGRTTCSIRRLYLSGCLLNVRTTFCLGMNNLTDVCLHQDILNRIYPAWLSKRARNIVEPDPRQQMEYARHLAKYVFPREFGLLNSFTMSHAQKYNTLSTFDWTDREQEIKVFERNREIEHNIDCLDSLEQGLVQDSEEAKACIAAS